MEHDPYQSVQIAIEDFRQKHPDGKVGIVGGTFDLMHRGHLEMLNACKQKCDYLLVCITSDKLVRETKSRKGSSVKPVMPEEDRSEIVKSLRCVDFVVTRDESDRSLQRLISLVRPDIQFFGPDQNPRSTASNISIIHHPHEKISTSNIIQRIIRSNGEDCDYNSGKVWAAAHDWWR